MKSISEIIAKITGCQYHFKVVLRYTPDPDRGQTHIIRRINCWTADRSMIASDRKLKKAIVGNMIEKIPRHLKKNGLLEVEAVYYLGFFKPGSAK